GVLGDDTAWTDVAAHIDRVYGEGLREALGFTDAQMVDFVRAQIEPVFHLPFGEVDLTTMIGPASEDGRAISISTARTRREQVAFWWRERARVRRLMGNEGY